MIPPARRQPVEQLVAPLGQVHAAQPREFIGPAGDHDLEQMERRLPVSRQFVGQAEVAQRRDRHPLHLDLIQHRAQRLPQLQRLPGVNIALYLLHHPRQDHLAAHRGNRRGQRLPLPQRIERATDLFANIRVADGHQTRQQQPPARRAHERIADRADRAIAGQQDHALRQRHRIAAMARQQARNQRIGKGAVRRDGK